MNDQPLIVIGPDGTILAAAGDLPSGLVDANVRDCEGLSPETREAGVALLQQLRQSGLRIAQTLVRDHLGRSVQLIAIEALAIRRAPTDVRRLLPSKLAVLSSQASTADVTLTIEFADDVPATVRVDAEKLAWAVTTLVGNALRYMQTASGRLRGGSIRVTASRGERDGLVVEVRDDGPGVPADTVTRLFKRDGLNVRGAGLSLLLISEITAAHAGGIEVQSSIDPRGHGTTVRLFFPAS